MADLWDVAVASGARRMWTVWDVGNGGKDSWASAFEEGLLAALLMAFEDDDVRDGDTARAGSLLLSLKEE